MTEFDSPWKEVLEDYLKDFLELCLPAVHDGIDWNEPIENQEKELPRLFPDSHSTGRIADKLFRVRFKKSDKPTWLLIHLEVQVSRETEFAQRMFTSFYRILDRFGESVLCIGIIGDDSKNWRPDQWFYDVLGSELRFRYPIVKLEDFRDRTAELSESGNPFSTVILSHLQARSTTGNLGDRFRTKVELFTRLYEKNWTREDVRRLFRFIDWVMDLPKDYELQFRDQVLAIEKERSMPYITSIERLAIQQGEAIGQAKGEALGKAQGEIIGEARGELWGKIRLLQELLHQPQSTVEQLRSMPISEQERLYRELRAQLASR